MLARRFAWNVANSRPRALRRSFFLTQEKIFLKNAHGYALGRTRASTIFFPCFSRDDIHLPTSIYYSTGDTHTLSPGADCRKELAGSYNIRCRMLYVAARKLDRIVSRGCRYIARNCKELSLGDIPGADGSKELAGIKPVWPIRCCGFVGVMQICMVSMLHIRLDHKREKACVLAFKSQ